MKSCGRGFALCVVWFLLSTAALSAGDKKPSILFCSPQGPSAGWVDLTYLGELHQKGFEVDYTQTLADLTSDRIKNYNVLVVYVTPNAFAVTARNMKSSAEQAEAFTRLMAQYVSSGGGVLLMPTEHNVVKQAVADLTDFWGAKLPVEIIQEKDKDKIGYLRHTNRKIPLAWTDQIIPSAVSAGVKQIWYPISGAYNAQHTGPLAVDGNWQVVVKASRTSRTKPVDLAKSTMPVLENPFVRPDGVAEPVLMAVRNYEAGRIALLNQWRQYSMGAGTKFIYDRQVLSSGVDGQHSDFGKLLENTFRWLAEPSLTNGAVGGYVTAAEKLLPPNQSPQVKKSYADRFWPYDAAALGSVAPPPNTKVFRGLIGAKTTYSSGTGSVKEYAQAAVAAGLDFLIFMDDFDRLSPQKLRQLSEDCKKHSDERIKLLPGFSIRNNIGNYLFFYSPDPQWVPDYCLTGPNKKVLYVQEQDDRGNYTGYLTPFLDWALKAYHVEKGQVGYYNFSGSPQGMRMYDLRLYGMAALRYYKHGRLVEDKTEEYLTTAQGTLPPAPASVNEVSSPQELTREVQQGHALLYARARSLETLFRDALRWTHQYDGPNVFVSDGPRILSWPGCHRVHTLGGEAFVTGRAVMPSPLRVVSENGLKEVRIYNGQQLFRRFLPGGAKQFQQILVLDGSVQKNLVVIAEDVTGKKAVSFARRCWKDGVLAPVFCSDHVNDCGPMPLLARGPLTYACIRHPSLPKDIAGDTWDGGPLASLPLTGNQNTIPVLESDRGKQDGHRFDQIPLLEFSDEGAVAVSSRRVELFDDKVLSIVNPWHTYGPIGGPSRLMQYVQRYREYVQPTVDVPLTGWAAPGVRVGVNAALFRNEITFQQDMKIESLSLGYFTGSSGAILVVDTGPTPTVLNLSRPAKRETFTIERGDWFGYYSSKTSNSNLFINRGEVFRLEVRAPYLFFWAERDNRRVNKDQTFTLEIASLGFPLNVEVENPADLQRYVSYLKNPTGMRVLRGRRIDSPGLVEFDPDRQFSLEITVPKPPQRLDLTLPCLLSGLNPRWSAGLFQRQGYVKGDYGTGENRYRTLGMDLAGNAYIPLYVDYAEMTHIVAGHPVIAGPEGNDLFIQVTQVGKNPDKWHVSVNNPTDKQVSTTLRKAIDLPAFKFPDKTITLKPGEYVVLM